MGKGEVKGYLKWGWLRFHDVCVLCIVIMYYDCRGRHITSKGQKDLDQIAGQVRENCIVIADSAN